MLSPSAPSGSHWLGLARLTRIIEITRFHPPYAQLLAQGLAPGNAQAMSEGMSSLLTWTLPLPDSPQSLPWLAIPLSCTTAFSKSA